MTVFIVTMLCYLIFFLWKEFMKVYFTFWLLYYMSVCVSNDPSLSGKKKSNQKRAVKLRFFGLPFITRGGGCRDGTLVSDHVTLQKGWSTHLQRCLEEGRPSGGEVLPWKGWTFSKTQTYCNTKALFWNTLQDCLLHCHTREVRATGESRVELHNLDLADLSCGSAQRKEIKAVLVSDDIISRIADPSSGIFK